MKPNSLINIVFQCAIPLKVLSDDGDYVHGNKNDDNQKSKMAAKKNIL